ncbi:radical SAM family heme chaperone HemW [Vallitalea sediminicola]
MKDKVNDNTVYFQPKIDLDVSNGFNMVSFDSDISIYIHIPFCEKKCYFCSIKTCQSYTPELIDRYVDSLVSEIENHMDLLQKMNVKCIHFGGGTPSIISKHHLKKILCVLKKCVPNLKEKEIVFEASPMSIKMELVELITEYSKLSLNIGIQTFDSKILQDINRNTNIEQIKLFFKDIKKLNLHTVGIDLICNLPLSDQKTTIKDINMALELGVNYFALYSLRMEAKTVLYNNYNTIHGKMPSLANQMKAFEGATNLLISKGFERYSLYHFNGTGHINHLYSRLQIDGGEWIGFGAGANSYFQKQIFANTSNINEYIQNQKAGISCVEANKTLNMTDMIAREIVYSLRSGKISKSYYINRYGQHIYNSFYVIFHFLKKNGYIQENEQEILLTTHGNFNLSVIEKMIFDQMKTNCV